MLRPGESEKARKLKDRAEELYAGSEDEDDKFILVQGKNKSTDVTR